MIETKKDDAASIVGVELSDALEEKSLAGTPDVLVVKSDDAQPIDTEPNVEKSEPMVERKKLAADPESEDLTYEEDDEEKREQRRNRPAGERSLLQKSFDELEAKVVELKSQNVPAETALSEIQPMFNALGETVKRSFESETAKSVATTSNEVMELANVIKSLADTVSTLQQTMSTELATLKAQVATTKAVNGQAIPEPRSISAKSLPAVKQEGNKPLSISEMAYRSTFR